MARRSSRHIAQMRARRESVWGSIEIVESSIAANTQALLGQLTAGFLLLRPFTVVRTHLQVHWRTDQLTATETPLGALGIVVVNDQAAAIGVTAIPDPMANGDAPFYVWQAVIDDFIFVTGTGVATPGGMQYATDSKAMRKVGANEDIAVTAANVSAGDGAIISIIGRMLVKLH